MKNGYFKHRIRLLILAAALTGGAALPVYATDLNETGDDTIQESSVSDESFSDAKDESNSAADKGEKPVQATADRVVFTADGGYVTLQAINQRIKGDYVVKTASHLNLYLNDGSSLEGAINAENEGDVYVEIEDGSVWKLTEDSYISSLTCEDDAIDLNGYSLYVNGKEYDGSASEGNALEEKMIPKTDPGFNPDWEYDYGPEGDYDHDYYYSPEDNYGQDYYFGPEDNYDRDYYFGPEDNYDQDFYYSQEDYSDPDYDYPPENEFRQGWDTPPDFQEIPKYENNDSRQEDSSQPGSQYCPCQKHRRHHQRNTGYPGRTGKSSSGTSYSAERNTSSNGNNQI